MNASCSMAISKPARTFQDLLVWQKAHGFVPEVYAFTVTLPKQETCGLPLQMRRAAVSIPANIAEGIRRRGKADKARFMNIAERSVEECRYFLILAKDLGYGETQNLSAVLDRQEIESAVGRTGIAHPACSNGADSNPLCLRRRGRDCGGPPGVNVERSGDARSLQEEKSEVNKRNLARRLEELKSRLLPEMPTEPLVVQIVYVSPDGTSEDGERITITNPGPRVPCGRWRP
ncbi:hypothetical protein SBA3_520029 [Candidatus Sulfopaludibacter sp. SbA3]|nr:hypothetical protein SBA3_520029 [Candidatus Sulfopaludibacter sp. SbA3]